LRPVDRFLPGFLDLHRASSVFLEPVSLGNYCIVATAALITLWREMGSTTRLLLISTTALMLVGSDGRLATVTCLLFGIGSFFFYLAPRYSHFFYVPAVVLGALVVVSLFGLHGENDDFAGRVSRSVYLLSSIDAGTIMHGSAQVSRYLDSGICYLIASQSFLGALVFWLAIVLMPALASPSQRAFVHMVCLYVPFNLLVSYSLFSIKTAAPLWFLYGYFHARDASAGSALRHPVAGTAPFDP
jgi:putative polymerase